eukprot:m.261551 g.261551  ORF g.261551 m.261551 type:complete len:79 (+) comp19697_c0_seq5:3308-3544(+)
MPPQPAQWGLSTVYTGLRLLLCHLLHVFHLPFLESLILAEVLTNVTNYDICIVIMVVQPLAHKVGSMKTCSTGESNSR